MVAEMLGLPQANVVTKLSIEGPAGTAVREIEGAAEKVAFSLPAVVSAQKGLNEPRYETLKGIMAAKKKVIPVVTLDELGLGRRRRGAAGRGRPDRNARRRAKRDGSSRERPRKRPRRWRASFAARPRSSEAGKREANMILSFIETREGKIKKSSLGNPRRGRPAGGRARRAGRRGPRRTGHGLSRPRGLFAAGRPRSSCSKTPSSRNIPPRATRSPWPISFGRRSPRRSFSPRRPWARTSPRGSPPGSASPWLPTA